MQITPASFNLSRTTRSRAFAAFYPELVSLQN